MKLSFFFGLSLFTCSVFSHPLDLPFAETEYEAHTLERRAKGIIDTHGIAGGVQPRYEIRQLQSEQPAQFSLLLLALQKWQAAPQSQPSSYWGVSSIHGVPRQNYNGVPECSTCAQGGQTNGYCTHDSPLFPGWHRIYMALFEQELVAIAKQIANTYPASTRATYVAAAAKLRFPYWDWAATPPNNGPDVATAISSTTISVTGPSGQQTIPNPFYQHKFTSVSGMVYSGFTKWMTTIRWPTSAPAGTGVTQEGKMINAFNSIRGSLQDQIYQLLTACADYDHFSNDHATGQGAACGNNIEAIHNTVHTTSGGPVANGGHMTYLATAAFDPVFWLHHCMVDRIVTFWQTLNPGQWGATQNVVTPTWTYPVGQQVTVNSNLTPFYKSAGQFWTLAQVQDWTQFGYTYPEFQSGGGSKASIASAVNALYGPQATATAGSLKRSLPQGAVAQNGSAFEYLANIQSTRYKLGGSYQIYVFLGQPASEDPSTWFDDANLVGPMGIPSMSDMQSSPVAINGQIPLTRALTAKLGTGELSDLSEEAVEPFLKDNLVWKVEAPDGSSIDPADVPDFLVTVFSTTRSSPSSQEEVPLYSNYNLFTGATHGKKGGLPDPAALLGAIA